MSSAAVEVHADRPRRGTMTRKEVAEFLGVSTRTVQRLEDRGILRRCPALGSAVRFPVGDVRKLASADWKEI
jgi:excisionase family DNA binding protein